MGLAPQPPLTREKLLDYFVKACRPRAEWLLGMEMEKIGRDANSGLPLRYDGDGATVRRVLESLLERLGGDPVYEGDHLIGIDGTRGGVSLEPGGQVEWSSRPVRTLEELGHDLRDYLTMLDDVGESLGVRWLDVAVDPEHPVDRMEWMPKARYKIMRPYMGQRGRLAHRMMTQTASIQCAFDFDSPDDWAKKFRAGVLLAPVAVALFANSSRIDRAASGYRSFRQAIWRETEPERTGIPPVVFRRDFGMESWVDWVCEVPTMFRYRSRGLVPTGGVSFRQLMELCGCDALKPEDWELHLSSIFTEVRSYSYIEVRSADLQPDDRILDVPTFWTGALYNEDSLERALAVARVWDDHAAWTRAMQAAARGGLDGTADGTTIGDVAERAIELSVDGLQGAAAGVGDPVGAAARLERLAERTALNPRI